MYEVKNLLRAFLKYGFKGFSYAYWRYIMAPKILKHKKPLQQKPTRDDFSVHMLVGSRDFLMGCWSIASFLRVMPEMGDLCIHSDGTLTKVQSDILKRLFPYVRIENTQTFLANHADLLNQYTTLKQFRETYTRFQIRIIDQHFLSGKKYRLFLDSDLIWFREPKEIIDALRANIPSPLMMSNGEYVRMEFKDGSLTDDTVSRPNGGIVLYREDQMDMGRMQEFLKKADYLHKRFGDQAWMAWTLRPALLPEEVYIIKGTLTPSIIVRHYTNPSRLKFYFYGLNRVFHDILK